MNTEQRSESTFTYECEKVKVKTRTLNFRASHEERIN